MSNTAESWGGGEKWMLNAAIGLQERGHIVYFAPRRGSALWIRAEANNFEILDFNIRGDFAPFCTLRIAKILSKISADSIILNFNKDVRVVAPAAKLASTKFVCARHGVKLIKDNFKYRATVSLVDAIITNTHSIERRYLEFSWMDKSKVKVIHNGIDLPDLVECQWLDLHADYDIPRGYFIFGLAGRLSAQKGYDILIDAMAILRDRDLDTAALIAGIGPRENELKNKISKLDLGSQIKLIGFLENTRDFLYSVDAVALPSRFEGLPNTVMEAMALGKIVVASDVDGLPELIDDSQNGFLVPPENPQELANRMQYIIENHKSLQALANSAQIKIADSFTQKAMVDKLERFLRKNSGL